jgi:hypothetical protein
MNNIHTSIIKILPVLATIFLLPSCKKFLEEPPSKTSALVVKTTAQIDALLNSQNSFFSEVNLTNVYSTDDCGITLELYNGRRGTFSSMPTIQALLWILKTCLTHQGSLSGVENTKRSSLPTSP